MKAFMKSVTMEIAFAYDNETPVHKEYLKPFEIGSRLVTNKEYHGIY